MHPRTTPVSPPRIRANIRITLVLGRVVAALRRDLGASQEELAAELGWDRSMLSRVESGRNTATIDDIHELEQVLVRHGRLFRHGDLGYLTHRVVRRAEQHDLKVLIGESPPSSSVGAVPTTLERLVSIVVDDWLEELRTPPELRNGNRNGRYL